MKEKIIALKGQVWIYLILAFAALIGIGVFTS